jgi:hypothetical protein
MLGKSPERDREIDDHLPDDSQCRARRHPRAEIQSDHSGRGAVGALARPRRRAYSTFVYEKAAQDPPLTEAGPVGAEAAWERIAYFLKRVIPVAEEYKIRMACHPHDPGMPPDKGFRGVHRVLGSVDGLKRFIEIAPSPYHGLNFCQGTISEMLAKPAEEIFDVIRYFGARGKIFNVHFRNIKGGFLNFQETFPDDGDVNMIRAMRVYKEVGYDGMLMPDHVPVIDGDAGGKQAFAYAYGYIQALSIDGEAIYVQDYLWASALCAWRLSRAGGSVEQELQRGRGAGVAHRDQRRQRDAARRQREDDRGAGLHLRLEDRPARRARDGSSDRRPGGDRSEGPDNAFQSGKPVGEDRSAVPSATKADVHTGDGNVRADGLRGQTRLVTHDGNIDGEGFDGALEASSGDGNIRVRGKFSGLNLRSGDGNIDAEVAPGSHMATGWTVHTGDGGVTLRLPDGFAANLDAHTGDGRITVDLPLTTEGGIHEDSVSGKLNGGGPVLTVRTGDGSVHLARL